MLELLTPQRPWGGSPTPLGRLPNALGEVSQRRWGTTPTALGHIPNGVGRVSQRRWETMLSSIAYHRLNVATSSIQPLAYKIATIGATATGITGIVIATIGRTGR